MVKICNIFPVKNQKFYKKEEFCMILAHLVKKNLYNPKKFNDNQYIIMDNGLYEGEQVSTDLGECIKLAEQSNIPVSEIIVPDAVNDLEKTIEYFKSNLNYILDNPQYNFMFVAQCNNYKELNEAIDFINLYSPAVSNITVGISKLSPIIRNSFKAIEAYKKCVYPIHFLGIKTTFKELRHVENIIRSCDTSQVVYMVKNNADPKAVNNLSRFNKNEIDLEHDKLSNFKIKKYLKNQNLKEILYEC